MSRVAPAGNIYQAGTPGESLFSVSAGLCVLRHLKVLLLFRIMTRSPQYQRICLPADQRSWFTIGSVFTFFFGADPIHDWDFLRSSAPAAKTFYWSTAIYSAQPVQTDSSALPTRAAVDACSCDIRSFID